MIFMMSLLTELKFFLAIFYKDAAPTVLKILSTKIFDGSKVSH